MKNSDTIKLKKQKAKEYNLKRRYGLTLLQYDKLLKRQKNKCFVCQRDYKVFKKWLAVDHDHKTGEIYGLLCQHCNQYVIGRIRDPEIFLRASKFLKKGTGLFVPDLNRLRTRRKKRKKKIKI